MFELDGWDISDRSQESSVVEPVHPFECGVFDVIEIAPGASWTDDLGLEQADEGLGQGVVVGVADGAHGGLDAGFGQSFGVVDGDVLSEAHYAHQSASE